MGAKGGGAQNFQKLFLIDFLAKLGNSKNFSFFFHFFGGGAEWGQSKFSKTFSDQFSRQIRQF